MQSIMGGIKNSPNQKHGVEERKPRIGGSTQMTSPLSCSSAVPPFPLIGSDPYNCAHITQDNSNDYTSCPATSDQQNKRSSLSMSQRAWQTEAQEGPGLNCPFCKPDPGKLEPRGGLKPPSSLQPKVAAQGAGRLALKTWRSQGHLEV